uniref:Uncharacterized protein n=1 Tax=Sinocyclocheilus rhinocerous TaxID=307959 RepID=A0A673K2T4_9TELE
NWCRVYFEFTLNLLILLILYAMTCPLKPRFEELFMQDYLPLILDFRIKPLSDAVGDLYKQFNTLKENLAKLTNKFDKIESFVDEIQAGKFPRPKLWMPPRLPARRIPHQMPVKSPAKVPGKSVWAQRRARRGPGT